MLQQLRSPIKRQPVCEPERPGVLRGRLAMRAAASRLLSRLRRPPKHRLAIARRLGVIGQTREVRTLASPVLECREDGAMKRNATVRRNRLLDPDSRELVSEADVGPARR